MRTVMRNYTERCNAPLLFIYVRQPYVIRRHFPFFRDIALRAFAADKICP